MTKEEALAYRAKWQLISEIEEQELRNAPLELKVKQLAAMMEAVEAFGWAEALAAEVEDVRRRWIRLKSSHRGAS